MGKRLNRTVKKALEVAASSVTDLAEAIGYHRTMLHKYIEGTRDATPEAAAKLAKVLRKRGRRLVELADRLEAEAKAERERRKGP